MLWTQVFMCVVFDTEAILGGENFYFVCFLISWNSLYLLPGAQVFP